VSPFKRFGAVNHHITVCRPIAASRSELWRECATSRGLARWQADSVTGEVSQGSALTMSWPTMGLSVRVHVAEWIPNERVVYEVGSSRLMIIVSDGTVSLTHEGLRSNDEEDGMKSAWHTALGLLEHGLLHHPNQTRHARWFLQPVTTSPGFAHVHFTEDAALNQWLTSSGGIHEEGTMCRMALAWGAELTGKVLANVPERDVAISWTEESESCLVFRTFPSPRSSEERLLAICWSIYGRPDFPQESTQGLQSAIERLGRVLSRAGCA